MCVYGGGGGGGGGGGSSCLLHYNVLRTKIDM